MDVPLNFTTHLGEIIRQARKRVDISQQELANRAGVTRRFIQELENGRSDISLGTLMALAKAMETTLSDLTRQIDEALNTSEKK